MRKTQRRREGRREGREEVETEKKARIRQKQLQQKKHTLWQGQISFKGLVTPHNAYCQTREDYRYCWNE